MDLIFEPQKGKQFVIEVGFFDTVLEIKHKIQKYQSIPVAKQTLIFNHQVLANDRDVRHYDLLHNSRLGLLVEPAADTTPIKLTLKTPTPKTHVVPLEMSTNDTVLSLKDKVHEADPGLPNQAMSVHCNGTELQDQRSLRECGVSDGSELEVSFNKPPRNVNHNKKMSTTMRVMVLTKCGTKKIPVDVSATDNVGELRKELHKLHHVLHFHLPPEGYFFIYKQNVMDDDRSFRWHHVSNGDTIEIFNGCVTGGS